MPHNTDAERAVLGSVMMDPDVMEPVRAIVQPDDFFQTPHIHLFRRLCELRDEGKALDLTVIAERLKTIGELETCGGTVYIAQLVDAVLSTGAAADNARIIADKAQLRRAHAIQQKFLRGIEQEEDPAILLSRTLDAIEAETRRSGARQGTLAAWSSNMVENTVEPSPPLPYLVEDLIPEGTLFMLTGEGGSLKTRALVSMGVGIANGDGQWPRKGEKGRTFRIPNKHRVMIYNHDSPTIILNETIACELRGRGYERGDDLSGVSLTAFSFPNPPLNFQDTASVLRFTELIKFLGCKLCIIDNLQVVKGSADENDASQMGQVVGNIRSVVEETGCSIGLIHHNTKQQKGQFGGNFRGSSAIRDLVDFSMTVTRELDSDNILIQPDKQRFAPIKSFAIGFRYKGVPGTKQLWKTWFESVEVEDERSDIRESITIFVQDHPNCNKTELEKGLGKIPEKKLRSTLKRLIEEGEIEDIGPGNKSILRVREVGP